MSEIEQVEIEVRPIKKIIVFEILRLNIEELLERMGLMVRVGQLAPLQWAEGIVFFATPFHPECEVIVKEAMKGNVYWGGVVFAEMPKYEPAKKIGGIEIPIVNQTPSSHIRQVTQWLKKRN